MAENTGAEDTGTPKSPDTPASETEVPPPSDPSAPPSPPAPPPPASAAEAPTAPDAAAVPPPVPDVEAPDSPPAAAAPPPPAAAPPPVAVPPPAPGYGYAAATPAPAYPTFANGKPAVDEMGEPVSPKSRLAAVLLAWFLGFLGVHRFYVGKIGTGVLMILTLGGLGVWVLIDIIMILVGSFRDKEGLKLYNW